MAVEATALLRLSKTCSFKENESLRTQLIRRLSFVIATCCFVLLLLLLFPQNDINQWGNVDLCDLTIVVEVNILLDESGRLTS